ncbi:DUF1192 family protein [Methylobacterium organophilum]|nr:DUF1192 family protein [Methylobacterium organophilum]
MGLDLLGGVQAVEARAEIARLEAARAAKQAAQGAADAFFKRG